jgi:hypothetical protein
MQTHHSIFSDTIIATTLFAGYDLIGFSDGKVTADDAPVKAVALAPATEIGLAVAGMMIGTVRVRAKGAIAKGDKVVSAAAGGVKTGGATPVNSFARALTDAADGQLVTIFVSIR